MKKTKRIIATLLAFAFLFSFGTTAYAQDQPLFIYGAGLNAAEVDETAALLGADRSKVKEDIIRGADVVRYLGGTAEDYNQISSVLVTLGKKGSGVKIDIVTPKNITKITEIQYANAAITAGIADSEIKIGAVRPVTGEAALTGVYKAYEVAGKELDEDRMQVANEELETVNIIVEEHKDEEGFDEKLGKVIVDVKEQLQDIKDQTGELATADEIREMIEKYANQVGIGDVITNINIDNLVLFFQDFQKTSAIDEKAVREQLGNLGNYIQEKGGELWDNVQKTVEDTGLWDQIVQFFTNLWEQILNLFR